MCAEACGHHIVILMEWDRLQAKDENSPMQLS